MKRTNRILAAALMACALATASGTARGAAGVAGGDVVKIPVEARGWGIGMAYSTIGDDVGAMAYNPAGLCLSGEREVRFTHLSLFEGAIYEQLVAGHPLGRWGTAGVSFLYRGLPEVDNDLNDPQKPPVSVYDTVLGGYISFRFSHLLPGVRIVSPVSVGMGIKRISMSIKPRNAEGALTANTVAMDLGVLFQLDPFRLAIVGQNIGGGYQFPTASDEGDTLPQTLRTAVGVIPFEDAGNFVIFAIENAAFVGVSTGMKDNDIATQISEGLCVLSFGAEYWRLKKMGVRLGYVIPWGPERGAWDGGKGLAGGGSFRIYSDWLTYQIDLAYRPVSMGTSRTDAFSLSLGVRF